MTQDCERRLEESGYSRPGFAARYDATRPRPPAVLLELLPALAGVERPRLIVDLGSGTGLSTRFWAGTSDEVVGVEPQAAMCAFAEQATQAANVRYVERPAEQTGLPDGAADIVTAAQSLQWMDLGAALAEVARILRPGGVFCAYEYVHLQTPLWKPEQVWAELRERKRRLREDRGLQAGNTPVSLARVAESGVFSSVREVSLHGIEEGDGRRLVALALSEGSLVTLLEAGATEAEVGLDRLRAVAATMPRVRWWIGYRALVGRA